MQPPPGVSASVERPSTSCASWRQRCSPRPVPPWRRVDDWSSCTNRSKTRSRSLGGCRDRGRPRRKRTSSPTQRRRAARSAPSGAYFAAFSTRLSRIALDLRRVGHHRARLDRAALHRAGPCVSGRGDRPWRSTTKRSSISIALAAAVARLGVLGRGDEQELVDQSLQPAALVDGHVEQLRALFVGHAAVEAFERVHGAEHHRERGAQLVGDGRDEVALLPVEVDLAGQGDLALLVQRRVRRR